MKDRVEEIIYERDDYQAFINEIINIFKANNLPPNPLNPPVSIDFNRNLIVIHKFDLVTPDNNSYIIKLENKKITLLEGIVDKYERDEYIKDPNTSRKMNRRYIREEVREIFYFSVSISLEELFRIILGLYSNPKAFMSLEH